MPEEKEGRLGGNDTVLPSQLNRGAGASRLRHWRAVGGRHESYNGECTSLRPPSTARST